VLAETPTPELAERTEWNVRDADATLIISLTPVIRGGTALTRAVAQRLGKPWLHVHETQGIDVAASQVGAFNTIHEVKILNVAGPRASEEPAAGPFATALLRAVAACQLTRAGPTSSSR
jgi:hypothetical protein